MKKLIFTTILFLVTTFSYTLLAQANLSIQGVLRNANGTAVDNGKFSITFNLYTTETGGTSIWSETIPDVDVEGGIYSVILGANGTNLDAAFDQPYFLGVSVEGGTELIPRSKLTSSPYALSLIGSDNVFPNSGNVGVGANGTEATSKLTVKDGQGIIGISPGTDASFESKIKTTPIGLEFENPGDKKFLFSGGHLGIGTNDPANKLHVKSNGQMLLLEGTDHAYMAFHRQGIGVTRSGYFGYGGVNNTLTLNNEVGETHLRGSRVRLIPDGGGDTGVESNLFVNGHFSVRNTHARSQLFGTASAFFEFHPHDNTRKAYFGFTGTGNDFSLTNETSGNVFLKSAGGDIFIDPLSTSKAIYLEGYVRARGSYNISMNEYGHLNEGNTSVGYVYGHHPHTNHPYSIHADQFIKARGFHAKSDRRIKKDLRLSDGEKDLAVLNKIEVTDYRHIDEVRDGKAFRKGLIAQQVESVFAEAIEKDKEHIPNVFAFPVSLSLDNGIAQFDLVKAHDLNVGDNVKIMTADGEEFFQVASIINEKSFTIKDWKGSQDANELFVYGKEVDDFRTVDYDRVFTLAVSATQELARKVEILEKENARLKTTNTQSKKSNAALKAEVNSLSSRMKALEEVFNTTGSN